MATRLFADPTAINFYGEIIEKEKVCRARWFEKNPRVHSAITLNRKGKNYSATDVQRCRIDGTMAILVKNHTASLDNRYKLPPRDIDLVKLDNMKESVPCMKPIPEEIKKLIHTDHRKVYLKRRYAESPAKRYNFIECTSWLHGWQIDPRILKGSAYGKRYSLTYVKGLGPEADPPHYRDCKDISNLCTQFTQYAKVNEKN
ncbi:unnamed protein product [Spodoptera littoralis]|uniref:Sperm microtubule inner protein 1 C-terminal domain-containing protein n=1 Tax=Spodoptera littoralis TaxID=7109 RepID=A0A9P0I0N4_SPOLI|nr:unnamed protein product [Spodoptera littoralis]CAH1637336.1 unnamed protein product [Spodoptera littoralis]